MAHLQYLAAMLSVITIMINYYYHDSKAACLAFHLISTLLRSVDVFTD